MDEATTNRPSQGRFDLLIKWLGLKDPQKKGEAVSLLCRAGRLATPLLVQEAIKSGKRSQHRIAILDVVQQIGGPLGMDELLNLQSLIQHRDPGVRQKAEQVIMAVGPCGLPTSAKELALMRIFNPFLAPPIQRPTRRTPKSAFKGFGRGAIAGRGSNQTQTSSSADS